MFSFIGLFEGRFQLIYFVRRRARSEEERQRALYAKGKPKGAGLCLRTDFRLSLDFRPEVWSSLDIGTVFPCVSAQVGADWRDLTMSDLTPELIKARSI